MDFIRGFWKTMKQHDSIVFIVDKLTKVAHFIPVKSTFSDSDVAHVFIRDVVKLHVVPKKIVSGIDAKFTSRFWKELFVVLNTELTSNTTCHP